MTHQEMNHDQATKLAAFVNAVRDDWDTAGLMKALETARLRVGVTPADLGIAAIKAATNPRNRTPAVIPLDGDHWREHVRPPSTPTPAPKCKTCGKWHDHTFTCPGPVKPGNAHHALAEMRANLIKAKRELCPHGVPWEACLQHDEEEAG